MNAIDREAAADAINKANMEALNTPGNWASAGRSVGMTIAENIIRNMPAVEVEHVRHGRWIPAWKNLFTKECYKCSVCGCKEKKNVWAYCHCGARMDGGENKERICSVNGGPCIECVPGAPCAKKEEE